MKAEKLNNNWKLKSIQIGFWEGHEWQDDPVKRKDRYEGMIEFENDEKESFSFKVKPDMAQKYIDLIANDIVTAATGLGERLKESLGLS
jgi:hypothetical protein